jgi:serine/threonine protein kinase
LYVMLCGTYPFRGMDEKELYRKIRSGKYTFREELNISLGAKRIIGKMLKIIPSSRLPA